MRNFNFLLLIGLISLSSSLSGFAQKTDEANTQVYVFTPAEMDNTQAWFIKRLDGMDLSKETRQKYNRAFENNMNSVFRLTQTNADYPKSEIKERLKRIFDKTNEDVKPILTKEQYKEHLETADILQKAYLKRLDNPSGETSLSEFLKKNDE